MHNGSGQALIAAELAHLGHAIAGALATGCRQMCLMDKHRFPRSKAKQKPFKHGFHKVDIVRADVPAHLENWGRHVGGNAGKGERRLYHHNWQGNRDGHRKEVLPDAAAAIGYG